MNKKGLVRHRYIAFAAIMAACMCIAWIAIRVSADSAVYAMIDMAWMFATAMFVFIQTEKLTISGNSKMIIMAGFFVRIILALWGSYGTSGIAAFLAGRGNDQEVFLRVARQYFGGDFSDFCTYYPYIINTIFQFTGPNRFLAQIVNILCWFLGALLLIKMAKGFSKKKVQFVLLYYTFCPFPMLLSTQLMRESMISFLSMLSFYFLWKWMDSGQTKYIIGALGISIVPMILHSGNIALAAGICLVYIRWDFRTGGWRKLNWRDFILVFGIFAVIPLYENIFARYLPYLPSKLSLEMITEKISFASGRSDYLSELKVNNWSEFLLWSIYLIVYFWMSPTLRFWNSPLDVAGFVLDSIPLLILWMLIIKNIKSAWCRSQAVAGVFILFLYTFIYAWGTRNAGTAMRHRGQLLGIMIMTVVIGMRAGQEKREEKKEVCAG